MNVQKIGYDKKKYFNIKNSMEKSKSSKQLIEILQSEFKSLQKEFKALQFDNQILRTEIEQLKSSDLRKTKEINEMHIDYDNLCDEITKIKEFYNVTSPFSVSQTAIFNEELSKTIDVTWINEKKDTNLTNLVHLLIEICNTPYEKKKDLSMIPLLNANENEIKILDEFLKKKQIKVKFILHNTRKQYSYFDGQGGDILKTTTKPAKYRFSNCIGIKFDGTKFQKVVIENQKE